MAFLQSGNKIMTLLTNFKIPSPTRKKNSSTLDSARNSNNLYSDSAKMSWLSASLFKKLKAGMTVEASIVLPLFLFFFMNIGSALEMIRLHGNIQLALWKTGNELAVYGYAVDRGKPPEEEQGDCWWKKLSGAVFSSVFIKGQLVNLLGEEYLENSPLADGADSLMLWESSLFGQGDIMDIVVTYSVTPWSKMAGFVPFRMANRYYAHIWNGYAVSGEPQELELVYVAENGQVYHINRNCTHLLLSVRQIRAGELEGARNQYGRKYTFCEKCVRGVGVEIIYITDEGDKYHYRRDCPGLKRTVRSMPKADAQKQYRLCSRCGKAGGGP